MAFDRDGGFWQTETGVGFKWEEYVARKYRGEHKQFNRDGIDVVTKDGNLDVKVCEKYRGQWVFNRNKAKEVIDYYYCICLQNGKPRKELLIPSKRFLSSGITVGVKSKYDEFIVCNNI